MRERDQIFISSFEKVYSENLHKIEFYANSFLQDMELSKEVAQNVFLKLWDKREDTMRELEKLQLPWSQIVDAQGTPKNIYGVKYIPHLILFGPDGTILKRGLRGEQIITVISEILDAE